MMTSSNNPDLASRRRGGDHLDHNVDSNLRLAGRQQKRVYNQWQDSPSEFHRSSYTAGVTRFPVVLTALRMPAYFADAPTDSY